MIIWLTKRTKNHLGDDPYAGQDGYSYLGVEQLLIQEPIDSYNVILSVSNFYSQSINVNSNSIQKNPSIFWQIFLIEIAGNILAVNLHQIKSIFPLQGCFKLLKSGGATNK